MLNSMKLKLIRGKWIVNSPRILNNEAGFSLLEVMLVLIVMGILAAMSIPYSETAKRQARATKAASIVLEKIRNECGIEASLMRKGVNWSTDTIAKNAITSVVKNGACLDNATPITISDGDGASMGTYSISLPTVGGLDYFTVAGTGNPTNPGDLPGFVIYVYTGDTNTSPFIVARYNAGPPTANNSYPAGALFTAPTANILPTPAAVDGGATQGSTLYVQW